MSPGRRALSLKVQEGTVHGATKDKQLRTFQGMGVGGGFCRIWILGFG